MIGQYNLRPWVFSVRPTFLLHSRFPFTNILVDSPLKLHFEAEMTDGFSVWHHLKKNKRCEYPYRGGKCQDICGHNASNKSWSIMLPGGLWDVLGGTSWCHPESFELSVCTSCSTLKWFQIWASINLLHKLLTQQSSTNTSMVTSMALSGLYSGNKHWRQTTDWTITRLSFPLGNRIKKHQENRAFIVVQLRWFLVFVITITELGASEK